MIDALRARVKMMDIAIAVAAPRNDATPITPPDQAAHSGRDVLRRPRGFTPVGAKVEEGAKVEVRAKVDVRAKVECLRIAGRHGDNMWRDRDGFARRVDRALPAVAADGDRNLVIGSTWIFRSA